MKKILLLILLTPFFVSSCSNDKGTVEPPDHGGPPENPLTISYVADDSRSESGVITPSAGGTVAATDANGIEFQLIVPANAVPQDETITMTPLSELNIAGPGTSSCANCTNSESTCCLHGAVFQPEGLGFDVPATLKVNFPGGQPLPFEVQGSIIYFNSSENTYELLPTAVDSTAKSLSASILHLSGYGTDDPNETRMQALFEYDVASAQAVLGESAFFSWLEVLENLYLACQAEGFFALAANIGDACVSLFTSHADFVVAIASGSPSQATIGALTLCLLELDRARSLLPAYAISFDATRDRVLQAIDASARSLADQGHQLCQQDKCSDGKIILNYVLSIAGRYIEDADFYDQVSQWLNDCCSEVHVSISASNSVLHSGILDPENADQMYSTITVTATNSSGDPIEGCGVWLEGKDPNKPPNVRWQDVHQGILDSSGHWQHKVYYSDLGDGCVAMFPTTWSAEVTCGDRSGTSDEITIYFQRPRISVTFDYSYQYDAEYPQTWGKHAHFAAHGTGNGSGVPYYSSCPETCDGNITREYHVSYFSGNDSWQKDLIDNEEIPGCIASPNFETVTLSNGTRARKLSYIYVNDHKVLKKLTLEGCWQGESSGCDTTTTDLTTIESFQCPVWPPTSDGTDDENALRMYPTESGAFIPFVWDSTTTVMSAEMTVTVGIEL